VGDQVGDQASPWPPDDKWDKTALARWRAWLQTLVDQFDKVCILVKLASIDRRSWSEKQPEQQSGDVQAAGQKDMGLRLQRRSPVLVISESKPGQGLDAWQLRR
jgi:hypothetical protein